MAGWRGHDLHGHVTLGRNVEKSAPVDVPLRPSDAGTLCGTTTSTAKTATEDSVGPGKV